MQHVVLRSFDDYFTANILLTKLQDAGIRCYLFDENTVTVSPFLGNAMGGIKLVVKKEDEEIARQLIKVFDEDYAKAAVCPKCFQHKIELVHQQSPENLFTAIVTWFFGRYPLSKKIYQCQHCGYESDELPTKESVYN